MDDLYKVSIIIACYNSDKWVADAIESALSQSYKNIEIICVDDGSTDTSFEVISKYQNEPKLYIIKNEVNLGVVKSRNIAIEKSKGSFILPLDADDKIESSYVEKAVNILIKNKNIGIVYCQAEFFGEKNGKWNLPDFDINIMPYKNCIHSCAMFRKSDFFEVGKYKDYMERGLEDWDLWLSIIDLYSQYNNCGVYKLNDILFYYRKLNVKSRSDSFGDIRLNLYNNLVKHHSSLYLNNFEVIRRIFEPNEIKTIKKLSSYRKRCQKLILINSLLVIYFVICFIYFL